MPWISRIVRGRKRGYIEYKYIEYGAVTARAGYTTGGSPEVCRSLGDRVM
jgi:hypothetical protein